MDRGQLSLPAIEAALGIVMIVSVVALFSLGLPDATAGDPQLDAYASDAATVLQHDPPRHGGETRLEEIVRSEATFEREAEDLERRVDRILPDNLLFRVETPHGTVGYDRPDGVETGVATVTTTQGTVTIRVWYA